MRTIEQITREITEAQADLDNPNYAGTSMQSALRLARLSVLQDELGNAQRAREAILKVAAGK